MECLQCGWCCKNYVRINPSRDDLEKWIRNSRTDILRVFVIRLDDNTLIRGSGLTREQVPSVVFADMIDPVTGEFFDRCPFLIQEDEGYRCSIHALKPEDCSRYRPWEWGDRGLQEQCPVVHAIR